VQRVWHQFYDEGVAPDPEFEDVTLVGTFARSVANHADRPALIFMNRTMTYRQLDDHVGRLTGALRALGIESGDRIAIQTPNVPQFVIAYYATLRLGAVAVPTNPIYTPHEIAHQWNDAECRAAIVTDYIFDQHVRPIRHRIPVTDFIITSIPDYLRFPLNMLAPFKLRRAKPPLIARVAPEAGVHRFADLIRAHQPETGTPGGFDDIATLLYTGGTTGMSKGAALTHRNLSCNVQQLSAWIGETTGQDVILCALPLFHSFGLTVVMNVGVAIGGALVMIPNPRDIPAIVTSVPKHRITLFPAVPNHFNAINAYPGIDRVDLSSIRACNSGSAPLPVDVLTTFEQRTGSKISEGYGLTETSPVTHSNPLQGTRKVGSIGVPLPGTDARIVDAEDGTRELPTNEVGELIIRGPQVMLGYWRRPDDSADMIRDGWLYTGDLARIDQDGFCFIEGRKKDMILCSGFNVYPDEIDRVLSGHPDVLEAATIGIPHPTRGETVKSFLVVRPGASTTAEAVVEYCREYLASFKVPREIEFLPELPKSSVLKILRRELRERELRERELAQREHGDPPPAA